MNNEKQYFDVLEELNQKGYKDFIDNAQIRQKYYFDNIVKPEK